jgi:hypothetical protein
LEQVAAAAAADWAKTADARALLKSVQAKEQQPHSQAEARLRERAAKPDRELYRVRASRRCSSPQMR